MIQCRCGELAVYSRSRSGSTRPLKIWEGVLAATDRDIHPSSTICDPAAANSLQTVSENETSAVHFYEPVILIARRDDHNPFFQVSSVLNAWIVAKALNWDLSKTKVLHLDGGYPSPVDELHQKLLSPSYQIVRGQDLVGKYVKFHSQVMLAPVENTGPMMQHLDDGEPCFSSDLFHDFRSRALETMGVSDLRAPVPSDLASPPVVVTVISRRPYNGRRVQRVWTNENEILDRMRADYKHLNVVFQSVDFVDLTMAQQMQTVVSSDIVIGMHGAGMVNVFWTRPKTLVVEIFPRQRFRWGYRNLCQFLGCDWHEFRGGSDTGPGWDANAKDKRIEYSQWKEFFDGIFRKRYSAVVNESAS
ncbi:hypothetical protein Gpo141_00011158 [Globisporangium polare]